MRCLRPNAAERPTAQELNALLEGTFLYCKGLGPTNKTLAAYLRLLESAVGEGEIIPPAGYDGSEDAKTLSATLWIKDPLATFRKRTSSAFRPEFLRCVKSGEPTPCLWPDAAGLFRPTGA